jgi:drug/metabolite transporter (DMT)-like permease
LLTLLLLDRSAAGVVSLGATQHAAKPPPPLLAVLAAVGDVAVLGEQLLAARMIGGGGIIFGVFLVNRPGKTREPAPRAPARG